MQQHGTQPQASEPIVHQPVTPSGLYNPDSLFPEPPYGTDSATALWMRTQREAYASAREQLLDLAKRYNALIEATGGPIITVNALPTSEPPVPSL